MQFITEERSFKYLAWLFWQKADDCLHFRFSVFWEELHDM